MPGLWCPFPSCSRVGGHACGTIYTDGLKTLTGLQEAGFTHIPRPQLLRSDLRKGAPQPTQSFRTGDQVKAYNASSKH
jgi:hypothetical protein